MGASGRAEVPCGTPRGRISVDESRPRCKTFDAAAAVSAAQPINPVIGDEALA